MGPKEYLTQLKLKKAETLLATTSYPVTVVADSLGFEDGFAFSRLFKRKTGFSPTAFRQRAEGRENTSGPGDISEPIPGG